MIILSQTAVNQQNHFSEYVLIRRVTRNFKGQGVFLELGHSGKHSTITNERKAPQRKNNRFLCPEALKNFILNEKYYPYIITMRVFFLQICGLFSNFQKRQGKPPLSPSSYMAADYGRKLCHKSNKVLFNLNA